MGDTHGKAMDEDAIQAFLDSLPSHLEPVLIFNDKNKMNEDDLRFAVSFMISNNISEERAQIIVDIFGFLFCPSHEPHDMDEDEMTLESIEIVKKTDAPIKITAQEFDEMLKGILDKGKQNEH